MKNLIDDVIESLPGDAPVRKVLVGVHWTAVCSRGCGLASTLTGTAPHGHEKVRSAGRLLGMSALELAGYARSENPLERSLGVAAMNSLLEVDGGSAVEINAGDVLARHGRGRPVAIVGHFPFIEKLRPILGQLWVIEQRPVEGEHPATAASDLIPRAEVVALTGSALLNGTLDGLLALCRPEALVMVLGPTTPLSARLFDHGATILSGAQVVDEAAALRTIEQGATFQQVEGVRLLTITRPGFAL